MVRPLEDITKELMELPKHQRLTLTRLLLDLDRPGSSDEIDSIWEDEIEKRIKAFDEGRAEVIDFENFDKEMSKRLST